MSVLDHRKLKGVQAAVLKWRSGNDYSNLFDVIVDDAFGNALFFISNSWSEGDSDDLKNARQWTKLSSVPENISTSPQWS